MLYKPHDFFWSGKQGSFSLLLGAHVNCRIPFTTVNLSSATAVSPSPGTLQTTWPEIVYAAITVGRASFSHVTLYGRYSAFEMLHRTSLIYAYLKLGLSDRLLRTTAYDGLDPSEKSGVSYFIGLMSAQLFSSRLLGVRYLSHLDVYRNFPDPRYRLNPTFFSGRKKPDLVGQNTSGDWVAIEAKGRTNGFESGVVQSAKTQQLANLRSINSVPPSLKVALLAYFESGVLNVHLEDPQELNEEPFDLNLPEREEYIKHWYQPFVDLVTYQEHRIRRETDGEYLVVTFQDLDTTIGLDKTIYDLFRRDFRNLTSYVDGRQPRLTDHGVIGKDGILVELGETWATERMKLEPYLRSSQ